MDLRPALHFHLELLPQATDCRITNIVASGSCGSVLQNIFDCKNYTGPILYQHYGCFHAIEMATFMISILPSSYSKAEPISILPVQARLISVEVGVDPPHPILAELTVDAFRTTGSQQTNALNLTIVFPPSMVGHCYYEVVNKLSLPVPIAGELAGTLNQPLPSGYIPSSPLTYLPHVRTWTSRPFTDYILIKIYIHKSASDTLYNAYAILPFQTASDSVSHQGLYAEVEELETGSLIIYQAVNTPVSKSNFNSFNLTLNLATHGVSQQTSPLQLYPLPLVRYNFPVLKTGSFRSIYSTNSTDVCCSVFTSHELLSGHVAFFPTDILSSTDPFVYHYNVTNIAGVIIARGEMVVLAREREFIDRVTHRKNFPLPVVEGNMAAINSSVFDFYTSYKCDTNATMRVLRPPAHGELVYENGSRIEGEDILIWVMRNTSLVRYKHLGGEELGDVIYWGVKCLLSRELQVFMSVLVVAVDDASPTLTIQSHLQTYRHWALPLSPSTLQVSDPDSPHGDIHFTVHQLEGTLLRTFRNINTFDNASIFFPLISLNSLISSIARADFYEVLDFSLLDLEQQKIWYFPAEGLLTDSIELTVSDSANHPRPTIRTLHVTISAQAPNETLRISTPEEYPSLLKNKPLPLSKKGHMFLTPYFLYSQAPPSSPVNVRYIVESPPQHGHMCSLLRAPCTASLASFTQQELNYHRIIYRPNTTLLLPDHFTFVVTVQGVQHIRPVIHTFNWTVVQENAVVVKKPFWLNLGGEKRIAAKFFRPYASFLRTKNITFQILKQPQYGNLVLRNNTVLLSVRPSSFTFADVLDRLLWYNHTQHRAPDLRLCSDKMVFDAMSPLQRVRGEFAIIFRRGKADLSVIVHPHVLMGLTRFTFSSKDFVISSSFCSEFVTFTLDVPPGQGQLNIKDLARKTVRELGKESTFTAKDIQSESLSYRLSLSDLMLTTNISDGFSVNASDPTSIWPSPLSRKSVGDGYFVVIIIPSPVSPEYRLEVNFSSGHPLTWLPDQHSYGYAFTSSDIDLLNSTLEPRKVVVQVEAGLTLGNLAQRDTPISFFTMADLQAGGVNYLKSSLIPDRVFRDEIEFGVYANLPGFFQRAALHHFELEWAVVSLEQSTVTASEQQGTVQINIRWVSVIPCVCVCMCVCMFVGGRQSALFMILPAHEWRCCMIQSHTLYCACIEVGCTWD